MKANLVYSILSVLLKMLYPLVVFPYITRVLGVNGIGEYNYYNSIVSYMALLANFGISIAGVREIGRYKNNRDEYSNVFFNLILANLFFAIISYLILLGLAIFTDFLPNWKLLFATSMLLISNALGCEWLFVGLECQKYLLFRNFTIKFICVILIYTFVKEDSHLLRYAFIMMLSIIAVPITNFRFYSSTINWCSFSINRIRFRQTIHITVGAFLVDILLHYYGTMDVFLMGTLSSNEAVGYYSTAQKVYLIAYSLLAATAIPLLPRVSYYLKAKDMNAYDSIIQRCYGIYLLVGLFVSFFIVLYAKYIILMIAGADFVFSSSPLIVFAFTIFFSTLCNFFVFQIFFPYSKTNHVVISYMIGIILNIILNSIMTPSMSYMGAAWAFLISYLTTFILLILGGRNIIPKYRKFKEDLVVFIPVTIILILHFLLGDFINHSNYPFFLIIDVSMFGMCLLLTRHHTTKYFIDLVIKRVRK